MILYAARFSQRHRVTMPITLIMGYTLPVDYTITFSLKAHLYHKITLTQLEKARVNPHLQVINFID